VAKLKLNPRHFPNHPQMTPWHFVRIGYPIVSQALVKIFGLADIKHPVCCVPHQIHAGSFGGVSEKLLSQPLVERARIRNEEQLTHCSRLFLSETVAQFQPILSFGVDTHGRHYYLYK
jgi:hypothetical protein